MALPVRFTVSAVRSIEKALEDLERALALISSYPQVGTRARKASIPGVRRVHLSRVRYHLYYRVAGGSAPKIEVLAFWHASRIARSVKDSRGGYIATALARAA